MSTALSIVDPKGYTILDPSSNISDLISANLAGEEVTEFDLLNVKVPSGGGAAWTVPTPQGKDKSVETIEGIVVYVAKRRSYWESSDPSGDPPDCYSRDMIQGVGNPGGECASCPMNAFGSAENERGKACKEVRALFMVRPGDQMPIVVNVPPGSLKNCKQWLVGLTAPYWQLVTRLTLKPEKNKDGIKYSQVAFSVAGIVPDDQIGRLKVYAEQLKAAFG